MSKVKNSRGRNWTPEELEEFALLLVDEENCLAANLVTLALKKSSNNEAFSLIKKMFDRKIKAIDFIKKMKKILKLRTEQYQNINN